MSLTAGLLIIGIVNTYANLGGSLVVGRCIDTPKC